MKWWIAACALVMCACQQSNDDSDGGVDGGQIGAGGMGGGAGGMGGGAGGMGGEGGAAGPTAADVQAIYTARCAPCHTNGAATGGVNLDDHVASTVGVPSTQTALDLVQAGDRQQSYLWRKLAGTHLDVAGGLGGQMPTTGALEPAEIELIGIWIDGGAE